MTRVGPAARSLGAGQEGAGKLCPLAVYLTVKEVEVLMGTVPPRRIVNLKRFEPRSFVLDQSVAGTWA
jgi:hypothetical protein